MAYKSKLAHKFAGFDGLDYTYVNKPSRKASRKASRKTMRGGKRVASAWNKAVKRVYEEMKRKDRNASFGDALKEASRRKKAPNVATNRATRRSISFWSSTEASSDSPRMVRSVSSPFR